MKNSYSRQNKIFIIGLIVSAVLIITVNIIVNFF